jgi:hypothetical protein
MTPPIERVRFFDGEHLRAFDFTAEQAYHVEMRRRLNMGLHLHGIVKGLELTGSSAAAGAGISQVSVGPGMAIDPFGREIYLFAPYTFDDVADLPPDATGLTDYEVWIQYQRLPVTPPSVGYETCGVNGQMTRWQETPRIVLIKKSTPVTTPAVTDDISEEGNNDTDNSNGVLLGVVTVTPNSPTGSFAVAASQPHLTYVGIRAQRIVAPIEPASFSVLDEQSATNPAASLSVHPNVFARKNLIVGHDFKVDFGNSKPQPDPPSTTYPSPTGNLKVRHDAFIRGDLYTLHQVQAGGVATPTWLSLGDYIKSLQPDVHVVSIPVTLNGPYSSASDATVLGTGVQTVVSQTLANIDPVRILVLPSLSDVQLDLGIPFPSTGPNPHLTLAATSSFSPPNGCSVVVTVSGTTIKWPTNSSPATFATPWLTANVLCVIVFYPK